MPMYEYECAACGHRFERIQKFSDPPVEECPNCGEKQVQKLLSSPAIQFKGTGWYITDYAKGKDSSKESGKESNKESKESNKESRESRESKESKESRESGKESKESRESGKESKESRESKESAKESKESKSAPAASTTTTPKASGE